MDRAGVETWLMHVLRHIDRKQYRMDFLVHSDTPGHYDAELRSLGSELLYAAPFRQVWTYGGVLREVLQHARPYDVVHSHVDSLSGYPLRVAAQVGIPVRIAHSHNDLTRGFSRLRWSLKAYSLLGRSLISRYCTHGLATSVAAGESLFGKQDFSSQWRVLPCGLDFAPFSPSAQRENIRSEFGISDDAIVIGHIGRFAEQKNHHKLLNIAAALCRRATNCHFVLVGDGPLRQSIEVEIGKRGLRRHVTCVGIRADVPRLLTSLFDVFLFPSQYEGLGLVVVEAQAAGCPAVVSDVVPPEADVAPRLVTRVPLSHTAEHWADAVLIAARESRSDEHRTAAYKSVFRSPYNVSTCVENLTSSYLRALSSLKAA